MSSLPAICTELRLHVVSGVPVVNSRDIAEMFEKQHSHVLRDIDGLVSLAPEAASNFGLSEYRDSSGRSLRCFDMTRDGFTLLAMGFTGPKALQFKLRLIQAFNAMEAALRDAPGEALPPIVTKTFEAIHALTVATHSVRDELVVLSGRVGGFENRLSTTERLIEAALKKKKRPTPTSIGTTVFDTHRLGGRCRRCEEHRVTDETTGERLPFTEIDHALDVSKADPDHIWLLCKPCHVGLTTGRIPRHTVLGRFATYQELRRELPGRQPKLLI
jgi:Rha family phage regulatory protein